uniref:BZIP domain-containing protein n=1 Tax=Corethron hystrix TaxID=216773 RepID=A0A7S1B567_9STRA|mmetsp:Transcript_13386/g.29524  ORF Transcript_13386/g.29524 Transcript_13386/m.29524 type:complete len:423 (+) Transcript_13386:224-1492(+)
MQNKRTTTMAPSPNPIIMSVASAVTGATNPTGEARKRRLEIIRQGKEVLNITSTEQMDGAASPPRKKRTRNLPSSDVISVPASLLPRPDDVPSERAGETNINANVTISGIETSAVQPTAPSPPVSTTTNAQVSSNGKPLACLSGTSIPLIMIKARVTKRPAKSASTRKTTATKTTTTESGSGNQRTTNGKSRRGVVQIRYDPDVPMSKEEAAEWRREQRRVRNRESAAASRQKTRDRIAELEAVVSDIKSKYESALARLRIYEPGFVEGEGITLDEPRGSLEHLSETLSVGVDPTVSTALTPLYPSSPSLASSISSDKQGDNALPGFDAASSLSLGQTVVSCVSPPPSSSAELPDLLPSSPPATVSVPSSPIGPLREFADSRLGHIQGDGVVSDVDSVDEEVMGTALIEKISRPAWSELQFI